ncbi:hypothetical protein B0J13DRAFT_520409 [Dactylonectria estremocensis]|uniref:Uncharacterized protein n=1 Tax=Dactylonectria estremocensis TaxID=1079267 RepID=A0A9P9J9T5_9HYPO|nr:hypothetical protein B0J13DRAFT_520409 [Dactylonectria estremocensis]
MLQPTCSTVRGVAVIASGGRRRDPPALPDRIATVTDQAQLEDALCIASPAVVKTMPIGDAQERNPRTIATERPSASVQRKMKNFSLRDDTASFLCNQPLSTWGLDAPIAAAHPRICPTPLSSQSEAAVGNGDYSVWGQLMGEPEKPSPLVSSCHREPLVAMIYREASAEERRNDALHASRLYLPTKDCGLFLLRSSFGIDEPSFTRR